MGGGREGYGSLWSPFGTAHSSGVNPRGGESTHSPSIISLLRHFFGLNKLLFASFPSVRSSDRIRCMRANDASATSKGGGGEGTDQSIWGEGGRIMRGCGPIWGGGGMGTVTRAGQGPPLPLGCMGKSRKMPCLPCPAAPLRGLPNWVEGNGHTRSAQSWGNGGPIMVQWMVVILSHIRGVGVLRLIADGYF